MTIATNKIIHRFIRSIDEYENGGNYFSQVIPMDTQVYAIYPNGNLRYVIGDGDHTYIEIKEGKGNTDIAKEYPVVEMDQVLLRSPKFAIRDILVNTENWLQREELEDNPYKYEYKIYDDRITSYWIPEVMFSETQAIDDNFSPYCDTYNGYVSIYAKQIPDSSFIIPTIKLEWLNNDI
jgi:hypothetical protein